MKAFMIAGVSSGIGKTTISTGLMSVFKNVSPFKVGPDYIDPTFHEFVTGNKSYNLDLYMMGDEGVKYSFFKHHKEISIVEGVMGLYDGIDNSLDNNSSAHLARTLNLPVILVVDGVGKSTSIAAQVLGYKQLDTRVNIVGVIINKVSSAKTYKILKEAIEKYSSVRCLGFLPKDENIAISSRHLGLMRANEIDNLKEKIVKLKESVLENIDIDAIRNIINVEHKKEEIEIDYPPHLKKYRGIYKNKTIAVAKDLAFSFYYNDNIEFLQYLGFNIRYFSPIKDKFIPDADIVYLGGGYPENFAKELSNNVEMIRSIRNFYEKGKAIFSECGGFMYLSEYIELIDGEKYSMCGLIPCSIKMNNKLDVSRFGYIEICENEKILARGHEFHYSKVKEIYNDSRILIARKKDGRNWNCIFQEKKTYAGYPHIHFFSSMGLLERILKQ